MGKCLEIYRRSTAPKDPGEEAAESDVAVDLMDKFDIGQDDADNMACVVGAELPPTAASAVSGARKKKKEKRGTVVEHQAGFCNARPRKKLVKLKRKTQENN